MNRRVQRPANPAASAPVPEAKPMAPPAASAARHAKPRFGLAHWRAHHSRAAQEALTRLRTHPLASAMTLLLGGLALALPLLLLCLSANLQQLVHGLRSSGQIAVFLDPELDAAKATHIAAAWRARADVAEITVRTPAEGLQELRGLAGFSDAIAAVDGNPLPYLLLVQPRDDDGIEVLANALAALPDVDQVQHDQQWRQRLDHLLALLERLAISSLALFGLAALLVIGNSVRLEVAARSEEIGIVKLLGASDSFVRRPFLWSGCWLGLFSALVAIAITFGAWLYLAEPVHAFVDTYQSTFVLRAPQWPLLAATLVCGVLLGCVGAYFASTLQLVSDRAS